LAKDALQHLAADAAGITLDLASCGQDSTIEQRMHEVQRLTGLSVWLRRHGPTLNTLAVMMPDLGEATQEYLLARAQGISGILEALAAAGTRPGGLPYKQLQLPVAGSTLPATVCGALSTCQQLKHLRLDYCCGGQAVRPACCLRGDLLKALQQMSHLTSLTVTVGGASLPPQAIGECLDAFYAALPSSLETMALSFSSYPPSILFYTQTSSLQHLKALRRVALPESTVVLASTGHSLATLTALTCLVAERVLLEHYTAPLAAPNLQEIWTDYAEPPGLAKLVSCKKLRSLACAVRLKDGRDGLAALMQLTQLTQLGLLVMEGAEQPAASAAAVPQAPAPAAPAEAEGQPPAEPGAPAAAGPAAAAGQGVQAPASDTLPTTVTNWGRAVSAFPGLRSLQVEPGMLPRVNLAALTGLTELVVRADWHKQAYPAGRLQQLLGGSGVQGPIHTM
jgi:hypothetical protein